MRTTKSILFLLIIIFCHIGCKNSINSQSKEYEEAFVKAFLFKKYERDILSGAPLVLDSRIIVWQLLSKEAAKTFSNQIIQKADGYDPSLGEAARDFCRKNSVVAIIDSTWRIPFKHITLTDKDFDRLKNDATLLKTNIWSALRSKYPNASGIISLSCPGFSNDGGTAIIYMSNIHYGTFYVFRKQDEKWVEGSESVYPTWVL